MGASEQLKLSSPWFMTADGPCAAVVFHRTYARVLRPSLAAALAPEAARTGPRNKALERFEGGPQRLWEAQSVAAQTGLECTAQSQTRALVDWSPPRPRAIATRLVPLATLAAGYTGPRCAS